MPVPSLPASISGTQDNLHAWVLWRQFKRGRWNQRLVDNLIANLKKSAGGRHSSYGRNNPLGRNSPPGRNTPFGRNTPLLLQMAAATTALDALPGKILDEQAQQLLENSWKRKNSSLASILVSILFARGDVDLAKQLSRLLLHKNLSVLAKNPVALTLVKDHVSKNPEDFAQLSNPFHLATSLQERITPLQNYLQSKSIKSVSIVGNSPTLLEGTNGETIDKSDCVIRFNQVSTPAEHIHATGARTTIWMVTPGITAKNPQSVSEEIPSRHIWLSSYLPYQRAGKYWRNFASSSADTFIESSHDHWLSLVGSCEAPPSAGLLAITALAKTDCEISVFGFDKSQTLAGKNHYGDKNKRSSRHNWIAEREQLAALAKHRVQLY